MEMIIAAIVVTITTVQVSVKCKQDESRVSITRSQIQLEI